MNEINALIWPNKLGIGITDPKAFARTAKIAQQFKVIKKAPSGAYRVDLAKAAVAHEQTPAAIPIKPSNTRGAT